MSEREINLDRMIDSALSTYAEPAADSGLEARLRARIDAELRRSRRQRLMVWAAGVLAAAACTVLVIAPWRASSPHNVPRNNARNQNPRPVLGAGTITRHIDWPAAPQTHRAGQPAIARSTAPKLDVFPTPEPVTTEEQALVRFAAQNTRLPKNAPMTDERPTVAPIEIAAISIAPIKLPSEGKE